MADLSTTRNYDDGQVLVRADLDAFLDDIETFVNVTKINDDNIQNSGITGSTKLLNQSVTEAKLATGSISSLKLQDASVITTKIADLNVTTGKLADSAVTTAKIADLNVTTAKINDAAVTTAKLATKSVTDTILANDASDDSLRAVSTNSIKDSAVTAAKIANGVITPSKLATNYTINTLASGGGSTSAITVSGSRPVMVAVTSGSATTPSSGNGTITLVRNDGFSDTTLDTVFSSGSGVMFGTTWIFNQTGSSNFVSSSSQTGGSWFNSATSGGPIFYLDSPTAGTYTYKFVLGGFITTTNLKIMVYEL